MKPQKQLGTPSETELVRKLVELLDSDPSDQTAAEALLELMKSGEVDSSMAMRCYGSAIVEVYFSRPRGRDEDQ